MSTEREAFENWACQFTDTPITSLAWAAWQARAALAQPPAQPEPDDTLVICPECCSQFRAIPVQVQGLLLDAGYAPPFMVSARQNAWPAEPKHSLTMQMQQRCCDWGTYWRASDAHGVDLTRAQALELLRFALGVEVDIKQEAQ